MRIYTVHHAPGTALDGDGLVLAKEGFCWPALFVPFLWLLYHKLWWEAAGYLVLGALFGFLMEGLGLGVTGELITGLIYNIAVAGLANDVWRASLKRRGYVLQSVIAARNLEEAELRFLGGETAGRLDVRRTRGVGTSGWQSYRPGMSGIGAAPSGRQAAES